MGKKEKKSLKSRLIILLAHLLKWEYQSDYIGRKSWERTIIEQRERIEKTFAGNPSLKATADNLIPEVWEKARNLAENETGIRFSLFLKDCQWILDQILDTEFWPSSEETHAKNDKNSRPRWV